MRAGEDEGPCILVYASQYKPSRPYDLGQALVDTLCRPPLLQKIPQLERGRPLVGQGLAVLEGSSVAVTVGGD